ncbi:hypothetical protein Tco_1094237, partial [Tanacetum coccineum]
KYVRSGCTTALNVVPWETDGESVLREAMTNTQTPPHATTVVIPTGAPATNTVANHAERPEKFNGQNFKRWQQKMFFYLTTLGLARFLKETVPQVEPPAEGQSSNAQAVQAVEAWKHSDFLCHNYVLNGLIDPLYNVYCKTTTAKELWESLERKYKTEDAGTKKFVVARFLDYKMVDSKNVISQVQDLQVLLHDIHAEGMTLSETFQVAAIIEKLPPSWVEFKNYLKHKRKEMSVEDLVVRLRIEEDNKLAQKDTYAPDSAKANMVEHAGSSSIFKANMVDENVDMIAMVSDVCAMISEVNLVDGLTMDISSNTGNSGQLLISRVNEMLYCEYYIRDRAQVDTIHEFTAPYSPQQNDLAKSSSSEYSILPAAVLKIDHSKAIVLSSSKFLTSNPTVGQALPWQGNLFLQHMNDKFWVLSISNDVQHSEYHIIENEEFCQEMAVCIYIRKYQFNVLDSTRYKAQAGRSTFLSNSLSLFSSSSDHTRSLLSSRFKRWLTNFQGKA